MRMDHSLVTAAVFCQPMAVLKKDPQPMTDVADIATAFLSHFGMLNRTFCAYPVANRLTMHFVILSLSIVVLGQDTGAPCHTTWQQPHRMWLGCGQKKSENSVECMWRSNLSQYTDHYLIFTVNAVENEPTLCGIRDTALTASGELFFSKTPGTHVGSQDALRKTAG